MLEKELKTWKNAWKCFKRGLKIWQMLKKGAKSLKKCLDWREWGLKKCLFVAKCTFWGEKLCFDWKIEF